MTITFLNAACHSIWNIKYRVRNELRCYKEVEMVRPWRAAYDKGLCIFTVALIKLSFWLQIPARSNRGKNGDRWINWQLQK